MSRMVKLYNEIFRLMELIDPKWEEILSRKDEELPLGSYVIRKQKEAWDDHHEYWRVSIDKPELYSHRYTSVVSFYHRGVKTGIDANLSKYNGIVMSKYTDSVIFQKDGDSDEEYECKIPYDYTASVEERKFSIDLQYESAGEREFLYRMVDFQSMDLLHVDLFSYNFDLFVALADGFVYDDLINRPFFKAGVKK